MNAFIWIAPGLLYGNAQPDGTLLAYKTVSYFDSERGWVAKARPVDGTFKLQELVRANRIPRLTARSPHTQIVRPSWL